jgi:Tfp pilus assembly protein PilN
VPPTPEAGTAEATGTAESEALLVPLSAWNRMLDQLGNLHEAGRELAEARERAARAETEAAFLRERLADLRAAEASQQARVEVAAGDAHGETATVGVGSEVGNGLLGVGRRAAAAAGGWIRRRGV